MCEAERMCDMCTNAHLCNLLSFCEVAAVHHVDAVCGEGMPSIACCWNVGVPTECQKWCQEEF